MTYAENLRSAVNSWASAYIQFETGRQREGFVSYAFVEDDDDKSFYQLALTEKGAICYLGCGGKSGVLEVYKKLLGEQKETGNLFFVDRDTEAEPFSFSESVLRTTSYSWESHVCESEYIKWFLARKSNPSISADSLRKIGVNWADTIYEFRSVLAHHTALLQTAANLGLSLDLTRVDFLSDRVCHDGVLSPGPTALAWFEAKAIQAVHKGAKKDKIEERLKTFLASDPLVTAQGKALFKILRSFVSDITSSLKCSFRGEINSAKYWMESMPWTDIRLEYICQYTYRRLADP